MAVPIAARRYLFDDFLLPTAFEDTHPFLMADWLRDSAVLVLNQISMPSLQETTMTVRNLLLAAIIALEIFDLNFASAGEPHPKETAAIGHVQVAEAAMKSRNYQTAIAEFEHAVELVPNFAQYHAKLSNAYVAARQYKPAWLNLRKAATLAPKDQQIASQFSRFWSLFDQQQGLFNVGQPIGAIVEVLGKPDQQLQGGERVRLMYGYYALDTKNGQLHEMLDLRGMKPEHLSPTEIITVDLDGRGWRVNYRVNTRISATAEYVLQSEKIQNWSELVSIQRLHSQATTGQSLEQFVMGMMENLKKSNPDRQYRILDQDENSILYEWKTGASKLHASQHEIARLFHGPRDMHRLAYVKKCPELSPANREAWINILKSAKLKSVGLPRETAKTVQVEKTKPSAATRELVWRFGGQLSGAAVMHSASASPQKTRATFEQAKAAASQLGIQLDELPELSDDHIKNSLNVSIYLMKDSGRRIHRDLTANYDRSHAALLELAIKSNMLHLLYVPNDATGKALGQAIKDRIRDAKLPEIIFQPLLNNIEKGAERKVIVINCLKLHTDIRQLLRKEANGDSSQSSRPT